MLRVLERFDALCCQALSYLLHMPRERASDMLYVITV